MTLRNLLFLYRHRRACRRLQRITDRTRESFACEQYRGRRAAALKSRRR